MNTPADFRFDHVGFIVRDLAACAGVLEALGFTLTPRAPHTRTDAQGRTVSMGSAQRSLMLRGGYIEFMEIFDPSAGHMLAPAMAERFGLHILAIGCADANAAHAACAANGLALGPLLDWSRPAGDHVLRFRFFGNADWTARDPSYLCWVQHQTADLLRPAATLEHASGADAISGLRFAGGATAAQAWARKLVAAGAVLAAHEGSGSRLRLGDCTIDVQGLADAEAPVRPVQLTMRMRRPETLRRAAERAGVATQATPGGFILDLREHLGLAWECIQA